MRHFFNGLVLAFACAATAAAQISISVNATANATGSGYNSGQSYTFVFTINPGFSDYTRSTFNSVANEWNSYNVAMDLWSDLGGSGLNGTYVSPVGEMNANFLGVRDYGAEGVALSVKAVGIPNMGMTTLNSENVENVSITFGIRDPYLGTKSLPAFTFPGSEIDPTSYLTAFTGTYNNGGSGWSYNDLTFINSGPGANLMLKTPGESWTFMEFTVKSFTISAIPEPSTYAAIVGVLGLALAIWRRRSRI